MDKPAPLGELLTTSQVRDLTGWSVTSINRWAKNGDLPWAHKLPGPTGSYLFDRAVVQERVRENSGHRSGIVRESAA